MYTIDQRKGGHSDWVMSVEYSRGDDFIASTGKDGFLCVWFVEVL